MLIMIQLNEHFILQTTRDSLRDTPLEISVIEWVNSVDLHIANSHTGRLNRFTGVSLHASPPRGTTPRFHLAQTTLLAHEKGSSSLFTRELLDFDHRSYRISSIKGSHPTC